MVGLITVNEPELVAVPQEVVAEMGPVVAPMGTTAEKEVEEISLATAAVPLNEAEVNPERLVPVMVMTSTSMVPEEGEKLVMVGRGTTVAVAEVLTLSHPLVPTQVAKNWVVDEIEGVVRLAVLPTKFPPVDAVYQRVEVHPEED